MIFAYQIKDNPIIIPARTREENTSELILNEIALLEVFLKI
jgi:hypothetical protein